MEDSETVRVSFPRGIDALAMHPTSPLAAVACSALEGNIWDGSVHVVDVSGSELKTVASLSLETGATSIAWVGGGGGGGGGQIAVGTDSGDVLLLGMPDKAEWGSSAMLTHTTSSHLRVHDAAVTCLAGILKFRSSPGAAPCPAVVSGSADGSLALWALDEASPTGKLIWHIKSVHPGGVTCCVATRDCVISAGRDRTIRITGLPGPDSGTATVVAQFAPDAAPEIVTAMRIAISGDPVSTFVVGTSTGGCYEFEIDYLKVCDGTGTATVATIACLLRSPTETHRRAPVCALAPGGSVSSETVLVAVGCDDGSVATYNIPEPGEGFPSARWTTGSIVSPQRRVAAAPPVPPAAAVEPATSQATHRDYVRGLAFYEDTSGKYLISAARDGSLCKRAL